LKSVTYDGKTYGIPTNNETMAFIWNAKNLQRCRASRGKTAGHMG